MSHTPLPWRFYGGMKPDDLQRIRGADNKGVGLFASREDAEFIVRAVNSHEELVEAAKQTLLALRRLPPGSLQSLPDELGAELVAAHHSLDDAVENAERG